MSEHARGMAIAELTEAFGVKLENLPPVRIRILDRALQKVPAAVLKPMVERVISTRKPRWGDLPAIAELLEDAEACRRELLAAVAFQPCASCEPYGWLEREIDGVKRLTRCGCWHRHQERIQALGGPVKALPSAGYVDEPEAPAVDDYPPAITDRIVTIAATKRLR